VLPWNPKQWTEEYLVSLIGQPESAQLEYKSGKGFSRKQDRETFVREQLSPTVSAFANSEGGIIIIGIEEDREATPRVAKRLDGIFVSKEGAIQSAEQFQQILESCISPYLSGIRVRPIALSGQLADRSACVIYIPQGTTAYQAKNHLYYSRSEYETKSMADHEVRLRMFRGRVPQASVEIVGCALLTANKEFAKRQTQLQGVEEQQKAGELVFFGRGVPPKEELEAPMRTFDEYSFLMVVRNSGEVTIRDFLLSLRFKSLFKLVDGEHRNLGTPWYSEVKRDQEHRYRFPVGQRDTGIHLPEKKIFPSDRVSFPDKRWAVHVPCGSHITADDVVLKWVIYLDDAPSSFGEIDLAGYFQQLSAKDDSGDR
jgi:hypothetical protein